MSFRESVAPKNASLRASGACRMSAAASRNLSVSAVLDQQKEFQEAEKRWKNSVREGRIRSVSAKEAVALTKEGWTILDVRPKEEHERGSLAGSTKIPVFVVDDETSVGNLIKQATAFGMGGWWLGGRHMKRNDNFLPDVQAMIPKESKVIIACQKGLRSLYVCEQLARAGYAEIAWLSGGFEAADKGDFVVEQGPDVDIRLAGTGGIASVLGWTEVQSRDQKRKDGQLPQQKWINVIIAATFVNVAFLLYELEQAGGVGVFIDAIRSQPIP